MKHLYSATQIRDAPNMGQYLHLQIGRFSGACGTDQMILEKGLLRDWGNLFQLDGSQQQNFEPYIRVQGSTMWPRDNNRRLERLYRRCWEALRWCEDKELCDRVIFSKYAELSNVTMHTKTLILLENFFIWLELFCVLNYFVLYFSAKTNISINFRLMAE